MSKRLKRLKANKKRPLDAEPVTISGFVAALCLLGYDYFHNGEISKDDWVVVIPIVLAYVGSRFSWSKAAVTELLDQLTKQQEPNVKPGLGDELL